MADRATFVADADGLALCLQQELRHAAGVDAVILYALEPDGSTRCVGSSGVPARLVSQWRRIPAGVPAPAVVAAHTDRAVWLSGTGSETDGLVLMSAEPGRWAAQAWLPACRQDRVVGTVGIFWTRPIPVDETCRQTLQGRCRAVGDAVVERLEAGAGEATDAWSRVQALLDVLPGAVALLAPVREAGEVVDFTVVSASPEAVDVDNRRGREMVGLRILTAYPSVAEDGLLDVYREVLRTGEAREVGPYVYADRAQGHPATSVFALRIQPYGAGLLVSWVSRDSEHREAARMMQLQMLGNLGWVECDLIRGSVEWSDHVYAIVGRARADGPMTLDDLTGLVEPADLARLESVLTALVDSGNGADLRVRTQIRGEQRHIHLVAQVVRDAVGTAVMMSILVQDVTDIERAELRLADAQRQLAERQRRLEAEHRLADELRHIILPLPAAPLQVPGFEVAVRYLPAEQAALIGGDWYHATALPCGGALLAVGDVAGHGLASAATMAELRHAMQTLTVTGTSDPAALVSGLNQLLCGGEANPCRTGTVVIVHFNPGTSMLTWAQAGHPAPLLVRDGRVVELPRPHGVLLGARPDARYETCSVKLASRDTLLLYTDGLVERRGGDCDAGLDDVVAALMSTLDEEPAVSLTELLTRLPPANPTDDMCILVARATC